MRYLSLFSGIGGFELGLEQAAQQLGQTAECVGYSEIDTHAIATYEEHFAHVNYGDATTIDAAILPDFDLLVGGFPCQPFSSAGSRGGFDDTRGTLFFDIARILQEKEPFYFILENVKGLLTHNGGETFRTILRAIDELGYGFQWQVLNSKNHGVPQSRERVYLVGHLGGLTPPPVFPIAGQGNPYSTVGLTTEATVARTFTAGGHSGGNHSGMTIIRTPQGDRRLTVVEAERLQGFPDGWTLGSDTQRYKQCGNAVTVNVVRDVAYRLLSSTVEVVAA